MKVFFRLIALIPVFMMTLIIISINTNAPVTPEAIDYHQWYFSQQRTFLEEIQMWSGLVGNILLLVSAMGVLFFLKWARVLYTVAAVLLILPQYADVPVLIYGWQPILSDVGAVCIGVALALMWTGKVAQWFEYNPPNKSSNLTGAENAPPG